MGFKHQMLSCKYPAEMLDVTENHINAMHDLGLDMGTSEKLLQFTRNMDKVLLFQFFFIRF